MKKIKLILSATFLLAVAVSCTVPDGIDTDLSSLNSASSSNNAKIFDVSTNNSGLVKITPTAEGAITYKVEYGHGTGASASANVSSGQSTTHIYPEGNYTVTITSYDIAGKSASATYPLSVIYTAPTNVVANQSFAGTVLNLTATATNANGFSVNWGDTTPVQSMTGVLGGTFTAPAHTYTPGVYTLTLTALSGGAATTVTTYPVTVFAPFSLPITYESPIQDYTTGGTFGGVDVAVVANPFSGGINTSAKVWKYTKTSGAANWSGTWTPMASPNAVPINIDNGNKIKVMVYSTEVGKMVNVELEQASGGLSNQIRQVASTVANQWEELVFDFSSVPAGTTFKQLVFRYNDAANGAGEVIYIDNVSQSN